MALPDADVAVVGAGPAGIVAARSLRAEGLRVTLIDPGVPPSPRIESLPLNGIDLAASLGLGPALARADLGRATTMQLWWREVPEVREFGQDGPLLLDRALFHRTLRDMAPPDGLRTARVSGMQTIGDRVLLRLGHDTLSARFVIDARGRTGLRGPGRGTSLVALAFSGGSGVAAGTPRMLLQSLAEGWLWACVLPDGRIAGAVFLPAVALAGLTPQGRDAYLSQLLSGLALGLPERLVTGPVVPAMLRAATDPFASPRILRIGDAALARDPIASHGLVHALRSGVQAAAAVATILDPTGAVDAASTFVRDRHRDASDAARTATTRSHAEQARHRTAFWSQAPAEVPAQMPWPAPMPWHAPTPWPALSRPLTLPPLRRAAVLDGGRIHWSDAIWLPRSALAASRFGMVTAARVACLLGPPASIAVLSRRLEQALAPALAQAILRQLLDEGALGDATAPDQAAQAAFSSA